MREAVSKVEALQRSKTQGISLDDVERGVAHATRALTALAHDDGHICFELEADATIPSEYVLFHHFRGTQ
ncbi:MAG: squalene--hopene cyclase, partial [Actinomycetospora chiangmaiensis]|nr:squalene--hopene cyclase [Actinomycetospora chiangmaiensis]